MLNNPFLYLRKISIAASTCCAALLPLVGFCGASAAEHDAVSAEQSTEQATAQAAKPAKPKIEWFTQMDFGALIDDTITASQPAGNVAVKGHAVRLVASNTSGEPIVGGMCFDTDLMRFSAGWTGGYLTFKGVAYTGKHGVTGPEIAGTQIFGTPIRPGWIVGSPGATQAGSDAFADPRSEPFGPLPRTWSHYTGHYINGDRVVFAYTVGSGTVLELPGFEAGGHAVSRSMAINAFQPATALIAELADGSGGVDAGIATLKAGDHAVSAGLTGAPPGVALVVSGNRILLQVPALKHAVFKVVLAQGSATDLASVLAGAATVVDPATLTTGGSSRYPAPVVTAGELGSAPGAYVVDTITVPEDNPFHSRMRLTAHDFFRDGRAAVSTWNGDVWIVSGIDAKLEKLSWRRFATGLHQPLGLKIVDDVIYVLCREGLIRLHDLNNDGEADFYENFNNDVHATPAFHEFAFDLWTDAHGDFYFTKAGPVRKGGRGWEQIAEHHGCLLKVSKDGSRMDVCATGFRAPNGMSVSPDGLITTGDNEGTWTPTSRVNLVTRGGFYGVPPLSHRTPEPTSYDKPILWLPHTIDNSCGGQAWTTSDAWGLPKGQLLHLSYGMSSLFAVAWSQEGSVPQGGAVRFPLTFNTGIMRARFSPHDGQLYVSGLKGWQTNGAHDGGFQRVRYTGKPVYLPVGYAVKRNGISITFANPLDRAMATDAGNFSASAWNYQWTEGYGSPEIRISDPQKKGHDEWAVTATSLSADGKTLFLTIPSVEPAMQVKLTWKIAAADGTPLQQDFYGTVNAKGTSDGR